MVIHFKINAGTWNLVRLNVECHMFSSLIRCEVLFLFVVFQ